MILRLEQYLARVAGGTGAIPESPETNAEAYLAILTGENRQAPEPITRLDMYLCNLIGGNYPIPTPNTRIEQYLAKACGLDIEVPTPITREEQLWHAIAQSSWQLTTLTGTLPLTFQSKGTPLTDYKLYGTSDGAGVETENLIIEYLDNASINSDGSITYNTAYDLALVEVENGKTYSVRPQWSSGNVVYGFFMQKPQLNSISYDSSRVIHNRTNSFSFTSPITGWVAMWSSNESAFKHKLTIIEGSTAPASYIPYGYKLPMTMTSGEQSQSTPIYIGDTKLGAEEYVDYGEQKVYRRGENLADWEKTYKYNVNVNLEQDSATITTSGSASLYPAVQFSPNANSGPDSLGLIPGKKYLVTYEVSNVSIPANDTGTKYFCLRDSINRVIVSDSNRLNNEGKHLFEVTFQQGAYLSILLARTGSTLVSSLTISKLQITEFTPTDPPVPLPELSTYSGENTLSCSEELGGVSITGYIKEAGNG